MLDSRDESLTGFAQQSHFELWITRASLRQSAEKENKIFINNSNAVHLISKAKELTKQSQIEEAIKLLKQPSIKHVEAAVTLAKLQEQDISLKFHI